MEEQKQEEVIVVNMPEEHKQQITKFNNFNTVQEQIEYAKFLIDSKLISFGSPESAVMAFNMGKALGIDYAVAATYLYPVNGKITLSVHLASALARKAGVDWEIVKDGEPIKDQNGQVIDVVTEIKFYRYNNKLKRVIENTIKYTYQDAAKAGYLTKDNWKRMLREMLRSRCLIGGIRFVASDCIMGVFYEASEIADNSNLSLDLDEEGNPIITTR
jgi:hypothetical protein